jgi:heat shock protein HslJ
MAETMIDPDVCSVEHHPHDPRGLDMPNDRQFRLIMTVVAIAALVILLVFAIASSDDESLEGTSWNVTALVVDGNETDIIAGTSVTATFDDANISGSAGCNNYQGGYQTDGSTFSAPLAAATMMFCEEPAGVADQETAFLMLLSSADSYEISGDQLTLSAGGEPVIMLTR